ncbi:cilia- and flagella- associated protein 210-like [Clytia hemisphaerica]|uniref:Trichohyalin-plectin-homology domain-containing protein n=1 Tax=Clytia hemisphaerica TaxID=252671 RepID=A0A7M5XKW2_9CNID
MSSLIMHGRREGQVKNGGLASELPRIGLMAQGINPNEVAVFQPKDWQRIQNNLARYNEASEKAEQKRRDRENLHAASKELVKHWENTIEGQRLKKLQARKLREEQEEEERKKIDIEEAKIQAQKRKEAIERAKQQQYYETDRVKGFHGALLLTEVLKERDAQIAFKNSRQDFQKERENHLIKLQKQNLDDLLKAEQEKLQETRQRSTEVANFQKLQVKDCDNIKQLEKSEDKEEGKTLKDQFDAYCNTKKTIANKHRQKKKALQEFYKNEIQLKREKEQEDLLKEEAENEKIKKFVKAKKKMANMRKEKEQQIFDNFQEHTEMMRSKLQDSMQQQIDDEDDRIAKAVAEREQKRMEELNRKQQKQKDSLQAMKNHRIQMVRALIHLTSLFNKVKPILKDDVKSLLIFAFSTIESKAPKGLKIKLLHRK